MNDNKQSTFEGRVSLNISPEEEILKAMKKCSRIAAENGISDMSLEEINEEIGKARAQIRTRAGEESKADRFYRKRAYIQCCKNALKSF